MSYLLDSPKQYEWGYNESQYFHFNKNCPLCCDIIHLKISLCSEIGLFVVINTNKYQISFFMEYMKYYPLTHLLAFFSKRLKSPTKFVIKINYLEINLLQYFLFIATVFFAICGLIYPKNNIKYLILHVFTDEGCTLCKLFITKI